MSDAWETFDPEVLPPDPQLPAKTEDPPFRGLRMVPLGELVQDRKPRPWLVKGFIHERSFSMIYGPYGGFKSFLVCDLAFHIATGMDWHGMKVKQGSIAYMAGEGQEGVKVRLAALCQKHGYDAQEVPIFVSNVGGNMDTDEGLRATADALEAMPEPPRIVIFDTLHRWMTGDENGAQASGQFVRGCDFIRGRYQAAVSVVHHTGKNEADPRGSSGFPAAVDTLVKIKPEIKTEGASLVTATNEKQKDGEGGQSWQFSLSVTTLEGWFDEDGEPVTTLTMEPMDITAALTGRKKIDIPMNDLVSFVGTHPTLSKNKLGILMKDRFSVSERTAKNWIDEAVKAGEIVQVETSTGYTYAAQGAL